MTKKCMLLVIVLATFIHVDPIARVYFDHFSFADQQQFVVNIRNNENIRYDTARVRVTFPDLDVETRIPSRFELEPQRRMHFVLEPEQLPPGEHLARISFSSNGVRRVKYVPIYVEAEAR